VKTLRHATKLALVCGLMCAAAQLARGQAIESFQIGESAQVTFEGMTPEAEIGAVPEAGIVMNGWYTRNEDVYKDNPSVPTVAFFETSPGVVAFDPPVARVSFYYASSFDHPVTVRAKTGDYEQTLPPNPDWSDMWKPLSVWDRVTLDAGETVIIALEFSGYTGGSFYLDDL